MMASTAPRARVAPTDPPFDIGNTFHITGTFARSPAAFGAYMRFIHHLTRGSELDTRTRELVILALGAKLGAEYEWRRHCIRARAEGVTDAELRALRAGEFHGFAPAERAVLRFAVAFDGLAVDDETWAELAAHYSDSLLVEISTWAGIYGLVCRFLLALRVELDDDILAPDPAQIGLAEDP
jgi:alkylhydroperoxidase family enzyme